MNALANDQLERLSKMLRHFSGDEVTFGRYTGETPWHQEEASKKYPDHEAIPCERFTREEIRENPPHILLTNFAMLEYLLIRPRDSSIFAQNRLKYIVLDEAHTYRGAQGIEVALLMRRIKEAFRGNKLQFFLTSATFVSDKSGGVKDELAQFASHLTGAAFKPSNVLFGETVNPFLRIGKNLPINRESLPSALSDEISLQKWVDAVSEPEKIKILLRDHDWINEEIFAKKEPLSRTLYNLLIDNEMLMALYKKINQEPSTIPDIAETVFNGSSGRYLRAIQWLLIMASHAKPSVNSAPLVGTRMHMFFRGLNGACVCLNNDCQGKKQHPDTNWSYFSLSPLKHCPKCDSKVFNLEVCWHCGLPVLPVFIDNNRWGPLLPSIQSFSQKRLLTWWEGIEDDVTGDETDEEGEGPKHAYVCGCGFYSEEFKEFCDCGKKLRRLRILETKDEELIKCPRCGGEAGVFEGVTRSFITADDAPTAVLAEGAIRNMPETEDAEDKPANGRRLLAFSDSRQRAAFFAPYLKRTTCESGYQKPLLDSIRNVVKNNDGVAGFEETAESFVRLSKKYGYLVTWENTGEENETYDITPARKAGHAIYQKLKTNSLISLYRHFCNSPRQRNKMVGLGLCSAFVELLEDEKARLRQKLPDLCPDGDEYLSAIQILLNLFMTRKAVQFVGQVQSHHVSKIILNAAFNRNQSVSSQRSHIYRFNPYRAQSTFSRSMAVARSKQLALICKWLGKDPLKDKDFLCELLDVMWECLFDENFPSNSILIDAGSGNRKLNGERILIEIPKRWFQCSSCGYLVPPALNYSNFCLSPNCGGRLIEINTSELDEIHSNNHLQERYKTEPILLEVKEHTAQLQLRSSQQYQERFKKGFVNVLSCSTTFEMGVDVGALKVAMLRNIPPSPANYIQRAGRVGRRNDGVSYVVTFSRKLPHDQYFFCNPERIVAGEVSTPYLCLENDVLTQRHANSYLLGSYMKDGSAFQFGDRVYVKDFFLEPDEENSAASLFPDWMDSKKKGLLKTLGRIIPQESKLSPEAAFLAAQKTLYANDAGSVFQKEVKLTLADYDLQIEELKNRAALAEDNHQLVSMLHNCIGRIDRYKNRFKEQRLIDFLSKSGWLPGYAFPQDVVELRVLQPNYTERMNLSRDREIGISEYAPGAEIIADGKVFKSRGVIGRRTNPDAMLFEPKKYKTCNECRTIKQFSVNENPGPKKCDCGRSFTKPRIYIIPEGFSTNITDTPENPRFRRIKPPPNSEIFLVEGAAREDFVSSDVKGIAYALKKEATLFKANMGFKRTQYRICLKCGSVIENGSGKNHKTLWGNDCSAGVAQLKPVDLASEFKTDVLQIRFSQLSSPPPAISDKVFWVSFLSSFLNGACRLLNIDQADLAGIYNRIPETHNEAELVIYDRVPGGAGYLPRITDNLKVCLGAALDVVKNCKDPACIDLDSACYACLRSYSNQFDWENLQRRPVIDWLSTVL
jgi:hypothetical protein